MGYNEKAKKTCLERYGNACSLHCGGEKEEIIKQKAQRGNREKIEKARNKFLAKLNENNLELISDINYDKNYIIKKLKLGVILVEKKNLGQFVQKK